MEFTIPQKNNSNHNTMIIKNIKRFGWIVLVLSIIGFGLFYLANQAQKTFVKRSELSIGIVQSGAFSIESRGTGVFKPRYSWWGSAESTATVKMIYVNSGDNINAGQKIMLLSDPTLNDLIGQQQWQIPLLQARIQKATFQKEKALLEQKIKLANLKRQQNNLQLQIDTEAGLRKRQHSTMTEQQWKTLKIEWSYIMTQLDLEGKKYETILNNQKSNLEILNIQLRQAQFEQQHLRERLRRLTIRSDQDGIVQTLPVEVGQQIRQGEPLFRIAGADQFYAEIRINQDEIAQIEVGQAVVIRNRRGSFKGKVRRIKGAVENGSVKVEADLEEPLPTGIRADQRLDATIIIEHLEQTVFVQRPAFVQPEKESWVWLIQNEDRVQRSRVHFGKAGVQNIQIVDGLSPGDQIILSEPGIWRNQTEFQLK